MILAPASIISICVDGEHRFCTESAVPLGWREIREGESKTKGKMKKAFIAIAAAGSAR
jgi:hypothetical protein